MLKHATRPIRHPQQQGHIDGLCAIYAILNACKFLLDQTEKQDEKLFKELCLKGKALFPDIVFDGTGVTGVYRLLNIAQSYLLDKRRKSMTWRAPLMKTTFGGVDAYFGRLRRDMAAAEEGHGRVWIIGLNKPWDHWTVVRRVTDEKVWFYDSYGLRRYSFDSFTFNKKKAGDRKGQKIMIDQHQSFLVDIS